MTAHIRPNTTSYAAARARVTLAGEDGERGWPHPVKWVDRADGERFAW